MVRIQNLKPSIRTLDTRIAKPLPKETDGHYNTAAHREWALEVKRRAGWRCEHVENGVRCRNRHPTSRMYADHVIEIRDDRSKALDPKNGACKCASHNVKKGITARAIRHRT